MVPGVTPSSSASSAVVSSRSVTWVVPPVRCPRRWLALYRSVGRSPSWYRASQDRKSTRLNSSHLGISYAVFCLKKKNDVETDSPAHMPGFIVSLLIHTCLESPH